MKTTALLAALLLAAPAVVDAAPLRPAAPDEPKRFALEGSWSSLWFEGTSALAGVRGRIRDDPFQFELSYDRSVRNHAPPDPRWFVLGGGGLVEEVSPNLTFYGTFLLGAYGVAVRDGDGTGWKTLSSPAVGIRTTLELRLRAMQVLAIEPRLGVSATLLFAGNRGHDATTKHLSWGGPAALLSVTLGAESLAAAATAVPGA